MGLLSIFARRTPAPEEKRDTLPSIVASLGVRGVGSVGVSLNSMLGVSAIFAAVRIRGETLSNLPFHAIERGADGGKKRSEDTWLERLLTLSPDGQISAVEFFHALESHSCLTGCAYAYIERNIYGEPVRLIQIPSYDVSFWERGADAVEKRLEYNVRGKRVSSRDLLILPFGQVYPYWQTLRPETVLNTPIALAQALDKEAYELFRNGVSTSGFLETDAELDANVRARIREYIEQFRAGGKNAGSLMLLEQGLKYAGARMTNKDAEFVDLKKQAIRDAGAIFGVPSYMLGDGEKANYASQEEQNRNFLFSTMLFRARLFENELTLKLVSPADYETGKRIEADFRGLMRGNMTDRAEYYAKLFNMGAITPNTIAHLEDLPSVGEGGDKHYVQVNMSALDNLNNVTTEGEGASG